MAKISANYELMAVYSLSKGEEATAALVEKFKTLIEKEASNVEVDEWGKRKLAYPINDETEAYYVVYTFTSATELPKEITRVLNITDGVLRSLITVK
jgi:small subunit ribosomal protein S6